LTVSAGIEGSAWPDADRAVENQTRNQILAIFKRICRGMRTMSATDTANIEAFDYSTSADLFSMTNRNGRRQPMSYKHFESAAEAIRYAIEEIPTQNLVGTLLEAADSRYDGKEIRRLYASSSFPLARKTVDPV
jgi:hypothetical protein